MVVIRQPRAVSHGEHDKIATGDKENELTSSRKSAHSAVLSSYELQSAGRIVYEAKTEQQRLGADVLETVELGGCKPWFARALARARSNVAATSCPANNYSPSSVTTKLKTVGYGGSLPSRWRFSSFGAWRLRALVCPGARAREATSQPRAAQPRAGGL